MTHSRLPVGALAAVVLAALLAGCAASPEITTPPSATVAPSPTSAPGPQDGEEPEALWGGDCDTAASTMDLSGMLGVAGLPANDQDPWSLDALAVRQLGGIMCRFAAPDDDSVFLAFVVLPSDRFGAIEDEISCGGNQCNVGRVVGELWINVMVLTADGAAPDAAAEAAIAALSAAPEIPALVAAGPDRWTAAGDCARLAELDYSALGWTDVDSEVMGIGSSGAPAGFFAAQDVLGTGRCGVGKPGSFAGAFNGLAVELVPGAGWAVSALPGAEPVEVPGGFSAAGFTTDRGGFSEEAIYATDGVNLLILSSTGESLEDVLPAVPVILDGVS